VFIVVQPLPPSIGGRFAFVALVLLLGGLDLRYSWLESAAAHAIVGGCTVVVAFLFVCAR
jgi:hypothetical protein